MGALQGGLQKQDACTPGTVHGRVFQTQPHSTSGWPPSTGCLQVGGRHAGRQAAEVGSVGQSAASDRGLFSGQPQRAGCLRACPIAVAQRVQRPNAIRKVWGAAGWLASTHSSGSGSTQQRMSVKPTADSSPRARTIVGHHPHRHAVQCAKAGDKRAAVLQGTGTGRSGGLKHLIHRHQPCLQRLQRAMLCALQSSAHLRLELVEA